MIRQHKTVQIQTLKARGRKDSIQHARILDMSCRGICATTQGSSVSVADGGGGVREGSSVSVADGGGGVREGDDEVVHSVSAPEASSPAELVVPLAQAMQAFEATLSLAAHRVASHVVSAPEASSPAELVVPLAQATQALESRWLHTGLHRTWCRLPRHRRRSWWFHLHRQRRRWRPPSRETGAKPGPCFVTTAVVMIPANDNCRSSIRECNILAKTVTRGLAVDVGDLCPFRATVFKNSDATSDIVVSIRIQV